MEQLITKIIDEYCVPLERRELEYALLIISSHATVWPDEDLNNFSYEELNTMSDSSNDLSMLRLLEETP